MKTQKRLRGLCKYYHYSGNIFTPMGIRAENSPLDCSKESARRQIYIGIRNTPAAPAFNLQAPIEPQIKAHRRINANANVNAVSHQHYFSAHTQADQIAQKQQQPPVFNNL